MTESQDAAAFWEEVRHVLKTYLVEDRNASNGRGRLTQARLAQSLGVHPTTLANFLSGTNHQLNGLAIVRACTLGMEFQCNHQRIGQLERETHGRTSSPEQLVLEFSDDFQIS